MLNYRQLVSFFPSSRPPRPEERALADEQLGDELVRASTGWNVVILVRFLPATADADAASRLASISPRLCGMKLFSVSGCRNDVPGECRVAEKRARLSDI